MFETKATPGDMYLRAAIIGGAGSGKTFLGLIMATMLAKNAGGAVGVIETEGNRIGHYDGRKFPQCPYPFEFYPEYMTPPFEPARYTERIKALGAAKNIGAGLIDCLSHGWVGEGGAHDIHDKAKARFGGNEFFAWKAVTPDQRKMMDAILSCNKHLVCTIRGVDNFVQKKNEKGKLEPVLDGMRALQRKDFEFEFDLICEAYKPDRDKKLPHRIEVTKSVLREIPTGEVINEPGVEFVQRIIRSLSATGSEGKLNPVSREGVRDTESGPEFTEDELAIIRAAGLTRAQVKHGMHGKTKEQFLAECRSKSQ